MGRAQRKSRKKMNKQDGSTMRDPTTNAFIETPSTHNRDPSEAAKVQEMPRNVREMLQRIEKGKQDGARAGRRTFPKKPQAPHDKVIKSLAAVGIEKKERESVKGAVGRMHSTLAIEIDEMNIMAKAGVAGKDAKEIAKEYKEMDEMERRKREMKLLKRKKEEEEKFGQARDKTVKRLKMIEEERIRTGSKSGRKKMNKQNREKERRKEERTAIEKEAMLDAKEVIEFGERYDAPPTFTGKLKTRIAPLTAKAVRKSSLLLHFVLGERKKREESEKVVDIPSSEANKKKEKEKEKMSALMVAERQRVIDAYRQGKRAKNGGGGVRALKDTIDL